MDKFMVKRLDHTLSHFLAALAAAGIEFRDGRGSLLPQEWLATVCAALVDRVGLAVDGQENPRHRRFCFRWLWHWFVALAAVGYPPFARLVR